jgi:hypothetical protein
MKKFKYKISDDGGQNEIWVCGACKKANNHDILTGKWKLIDRSASNGVACGIWVVKGKKDLHE